MEETLVFETGCDLAGQQVLGYASDKEGIISFWGALKGIEGTYEDSSMLFHFTGSSLEYIFPNDHGFITFNNYIRLCASNEKIKRFFCYIVKKTKNQRIKSFAQSLLDDKQN